MGCKNHSALKDLRNSAIVLNLNGFRAQRTDGCVHSQIRRSIVQSPLFSLFNRTLSFSHCCLLWPLYHSASLHTLYTIHSQTHSQKCMHVLLFFHSLAVSTSTSIASLFHLPSPLFLSPFLFLSTEERDKEIVFFLHQSGQHNYTNQQTRFSLCVSPACPLFHSPPPFLSFQTLRNQTQRNKRANASYSTSIHHLSSDTWLHTLTQAVIFCWLLWHNLWR